MQLDDGTTTLTFYPVAQELVVRDPATIQRARDGSIVAVNDNGETLVRERRIDLRLSSAEVTTFEAFWLANDAATVTFTDTVGRDWTAWWLGDLEVSEEAYTADGWYRLSLRLRLDAVASDAGRTAYANTDVGQMSVQVSGETELHFPIAYTHPLDRIQQRRAHLRTRPGFVAVDDARYVARATRRLRFQALSDAFVSELEDYVVDTMAGARQPFDLVHFRDGTSTYRLVDGLKLTQDEGLRWSGTLTVVDDV